MTFLPLALVLSQVVTAPPAPASPAPGVPSANPGSVTAEVNIVAQNVASARARALEDAFVQAVDRRFASLVAEAGVDPAGVLPPPWALLRATLRSRSPRFIRGYRILGEGEVAAVYRVELEADVDDVLLRRELDKARPSAEAPRAGALAVVPAPGTSDEVVRAVLAELGAAAIAAESFPTVAPTGRAIVRVAGAVSFEGWVRGVGVTSTACTVTLSWTPAGSSPQDFRPVQKRVFSAAATPASQACLRQASAESVSELAAALAPGLAARFVTLTFDTSAASTHESVQRYLRRLAAVSAVDLRRLSVTGFELRVVTRLAASALLAALTRDSVGQLAFEVLAQDAEHARARVRPVAPITTGAPAP